MTDDAASPSPTGSGQGSDETISTPDTAEELLNLFIVLAAFATALAVASAV